MKTQILKSALSIAAIAVLSLGLFSFENSTNHEALIKGKDTSDTLQNFKG
jgi:hypothetical protein